MRKEEIQIGRVYIVRVSGREVPVRIERYDWHRGFSGRNLVTGRTIQIRSARRIRREATQHEVQEHQQ